MENNAQKKRGCFSFWHTIKETKGHDLCVFAFGRNQSNLPSHWELFRRSVQRMQQHFPARLEQQNQEPNPIYFPFIKSISLFPIYLLLYTAVGIVLIIVRSYVACAMHTWKGFSTYGHGSNLPENPLAQKRIGGVRFGSSLDKFLFKFHSSYSHRTLYVLLSHRGEKKQLFCSAF